MSKLDELIAWAESFAGGSPEGPQIAALLRAGQGMREWDSYEAGTEAWDAALQEDEG